MTAKRTLRTIILALAVAGTAGALAIGCGGDDTNPDTGKDAGKSDAPFHSDGGPTDNDGGPTDKDGGPTDNDGGPGTDGGDGGPRDFAAYVIDLITKQTNETTPPTKDLCDNCADKQDKMDFKVLFP